jgi:hypothetical protein
MATTRPPVERPRTKAALSGVEHHDEAIAVTGSRWTSEKRARVGGLGRGGAAGFPLREWASWTVRSRCCDARALRGPVTGSP